MKLLDEEEKQVKLQLDQFEQMVTVCAFVEFDKSSRLRS